jgi:hypothetical protein
MARREQGTPLSDAGVARLVPLHGVFVLVRYERHTDGAAESSGSVPLFRRVVVQVRRASCHRER